MQPKRLGINNQSQEASNVDLSCLQDLFGQEEMDFSTRKRETFETRKKLLSEAGTANFDTYMYYIVMELKDIGEVRVI